MRLLQIFALFLSFGTAITPSQAQDIKGGKDHPLISRFAASQLDGFQEVGFGQGLYYLPDTAAPAKELQWDKPVTVEGKVTRLLYLAPKGKSPLEVHRNFEMALKSAGATIKTSVNGKDAWWEPAKHWRSNFSEMTFQGVWAADVSPFWRDGLYVYGILKRNGSIYHVSILTAQNFNESKSQEAAVAIQIIEPIAMQTGQVTINADAMKQGLNVEGKIALYGVHFDSGKSELKPDSKAQLDEMGKFLKQNAALKVFVVGHTDNQGNHEANIALSQRRAEAVVTALVKDYKIDTKRLIAKGAANISPVANNNSEAGRTKNRRVELVEQ